MYHSKEHEKLIKKNITTYIWKRIAWEIKGKISKMTSHKVTSSYIKTSSKFKNFCSIRLRTFQGTKNIITKKFEFQAIKIFLDSFVLLEQGFGESLRIWRSALSQAALQSKQNFMGRFSFVGASHFDLMPFRINIFLFFERFSVDWNKNIWILTKFLCSMTSLFVFFFVISPSLFVFRYMLWYFSWSVFHALSNGA